jgi:hypothetical protein
MNAKPSDPIEVKEARQLLVRYAELCNRAIRQNAHKAWFRKAKQASKLVVGGSKFHTIVYENDPGQPVTEATLQFDAGRETIRVLDDDAKDAAFTWKISTSYLRDVVETRPNWYVANPLRLDWKWLADRVGDEWRERNSEPVALGFLVGLAFATVMSLLRPRDHYR